IAQSGRTADGNYPIARTQSFSCAERSDRQVIGINFDQRQIGELVASNYRSVKYALIIERDLDVGSIADNVIVGKDVAVWFDDDTRAGAAHFILLHMRHNWFFAEKIEREAAETAQLKAAGN